jgi:hypothetical protein
MSDDVRCESLAGVCRSTRGIDPDRCRKESTYKVKDAGTWRRVCSRHIAYHVFHDADAVGDSQRERAARVMEG